jgi:hypothetical protein
MLPLSISTLPQLLVQLLALAVGLASLFLYLVAFVIPVLYRKKDLLWSGLGLFYAVVLWFCAAQFSLPVLAGQVASVLLLGWLSTQALQFRWLQLSDVQKASVPIAGRAARKRKAAQAKQPQAAPEPAPVPSQSAPSDLDDESDEDFESDALEQEPEQAAEPGLEPTPSEPVSQAEFSSSDEPAETTMADDQDTTEPTKSAKPGVFARAQNFFQGRKSHGKRYVRPEDGETDEPSGESTLDADLEEAVAIEPESSPEPEVVAEEPESSPEPEAGAIESESETTIEAETNPTSEVNPDLEPAAPAESPESATESDDQSVS